MRKLAIVLSAAALAACVAVDSDRMPVPRPGPAKSQGHGPPPHAPAHGYRAKTPQGVNVVFDTQIGVYVVVDLPGSYWLDDRYYRKATSGWTVSASFDGPWQPCPTAELPKGLQGGASGKPGKSGKAKGKN
ncbi:MAG: hypothetical protein WEF50_06045 [Myxococcota bacterium]